MSIVRVGGSLARVGGALGRGGAGGGGKSVLTSADLSLLGYYRFPYSTWNMDYGGYNIAIRKVGADTRLFTYSNDSGRKLIEYVLPTGSAPSTTISSAPRMTYVGNYGDIWSGVMASGSAGVDITVGALHWDDARGGLWFTYGDAYAPTKHHPTLGFVTLGSGTHTRYGPWRTEWVSNRTRGGLVSIPSSFASTYTSGNTLGVMAGQASGNNSSPFGCNLSALTLVDPFTASADVGTPPAAGQYSVANQGLILHTSTTRQTRDTRYTVCGWSQQGDPGHQHYNCTLNTYLRAGTSAWGGDGFVAYEDDTVSSCVWIDTPTKHGVIWFGQLVTTPQGYTPPGNDPNGYAHVWYGNYEHATATGTSGTVLNGVTLANNKCCHGQDDAHWNSTGPGAHYRVPHAWFYNPDDFIATAQGAALGSRTPVEVKQYTDAGNSGMVSWPGLLTSFNRAGWIGGSYYDSDTGLVYLMLRNQDETSVYNNGSGQYLRRQPIVAVFQVSA